MGSEEPNEKSNSHKSTPNPTPQATGKTPAEKGWVEKLAERSAGLPETSGTKPEAKSEATQKSSLWKFAGLGIQFAGTVGLMAYVGYEIDRWQGWKSNPTLLTLVVIGVIGNMYLLIKEAMKANK